MDDGPAPVVGQAGDVGQLVDLTGGGDDPAGPDDVTTRQGGAQAGLVAGDVGDAAAEHLDAVRADLLAGDAQEVGRGTPFVPEIAVHVGCGGIAGLAGVDDDDRPALAGELERRGEARGGSADDGDVDGALDRGVGAVAVGTVGVLLGGVVLGGVVLGCAHDVHGRPDLRISPTLLQYSQDALLRISLGKSPEGWTSP